jgi:hypothetical protein
MYELAEFVELVFAADEAVRLLGEVRLYRVCPYTMVYIIWTMRYRVNLV